MKKKRRLKKSVKRILIAIGTAWTVLLVVLLVMGPFSKNAINARAFQKLATAAPSNDTVVFNDLVPFEWDTVYRFAPYMEKTHMVQIIGADSRHLSETVSEGMEQFIFVQNGKIVCCITGYSASLGYEFSFPDMHDGYIAIRAAEELVFTVTAKDGVNHYLLAG